MPIFLSLIIPAHNEEKRLPPTLAAVNAYLEKQASLSEIIVVENGKPVMVVLSFEDFKARTARSVQGQRAAQAPVQAPLQEPQNTDEELTIDDLPL